jgi:alpha-1,3-glucan synthase
LHSGKHKILTSRKGQIIAANSYQITVLTGEYGKAAEKLYMVAGLYCVATAVWWYLFRRIKTLHILSTPFALYGLAFLLLAMGMYAPSVNAKYWFFNVATGLYAAASASGSIFFATNFGTEGIAVSSFSFQQSLLTNSL